MYAYYTSFVSKIFAFFINFVKLQKFISKVLIISPYIYT